MMKLRANLRIVWDSFIIQLKVQKLSDLFLSTGLVQPILFTMMTVGIYMYGKKPEFGLYAIMGTGLISIWNNNLFTSGDIINWERRSQTLALLMATPTSLALIMLGKSLANSVISIFAMGIAFLTGIIIFRMSPGIVHPGAFMLGLLLIIIAMTCMGLVFGSLFILSRRAEDFIIVANYPVYILSGLTLPLTLLPVWTKPLSALLAPTWGNVILNKAASQIIGNLSLYYLYLLALSGLYLLIAWILFRRVEFMAMKRGSLEVW
jgi:ABC-2 type transport system permease protein